MTRNKSNTLAAPGIGVFYGRYSDHNQKDISIEQQLDRCKVFAERENLLISEVYADRAITGRTDKRPAFQRMMRDAEKGKFSYVIAWKSNRIGRNMLQAMVNEERLREYGVKVYYVEESFADNAAGRFALRSMMNVNQFYSENLAEDVMRGMISNAERCMVNGPLPLGYRRGDDGKHAIDEKTAPIVREIFERVAEGDQLIAITRDFNERGLRTSKGNLWNKSSFQKMLGNDVYIGVYRFADVCIEGGVPPIISPELFFKVGERMNTKINPQGRRRGDNGEYLLTGKLFCGHCKSPMIGISGTSKGKSLHYYYSCNGRRVQKVCKKTHVRRDYIERLVAEYVKEYVLQDDMIEWLIEQYLGFVKRMESESELEANKRDLEAVQRSIKNLVTAIEEGIITSKTKQRLIELEEHERHLMMTIRIEETELPSFNQDKIRFWLESFRDGDVEDKEYQEQVISMFVSEVYLYDDEIKIVFGYSDSTKAVRRRLDKKDIDKVPEEVYSVRINVPEGSPNTFKGEL